MKAEVINQFSPDLHLSVKISHNTESLVFAATPFGKKSFNETFDVFEQINQYWSELPDAKQTHIFSIYTHIFSLFNTTWSNESRTIHLNRAVVELLDLHDFNTVFRWVTFSSRAGIQVPPDFQKDYIESVDRQTSREQTYLRSDYTRLVTLCVILRLMIPIWGEYIKLTRQEKGNLFKETFAFALMNRSALLHSEPFVKLRTYLEFNTRASTANPGKIIEGISSEDFLNWLLAVVTVGVLCTSDIRGIEPRPHLVNRLFQYIRQKTSGKEASPENVIRDKRHERETDGGLNEKLSVLEWYKIKNKMSMGEIEELEHSLRDLRHCAFQLSAAMSEELLERCLTSSVLLLHQPIADAQITLMRWIFKPIISPKGLLYLSKERIVQCLGVTQAVLWARGHAYLSILSSCYKEPFDGLQAPPIISVDARSQLPKEIIAELNKLYPYTKFLGGRKAAAKFNHSGFDTTMDLRNTSRKSSPKPVNLALEAIKDLSDQFASTTWLATADDGFLNETFQQITHRRVSIEPDLRLYLAQLVIELGARRWS